TIEVSMGVDPVTAGWHSFLYQIVGIAAGLGVTPFMRRRSDHRAVGVVISLLLITAILGLLLVPELLVFCPRGARARARRSSGATAGPGPPTRAGCREWPRASGTCWLPRDRLGRACCSRPP